MRQHDPVQSVNSVSAANAHKDLAMLPNLDGIRAVACLLVVLTHIPLPIKMEVLGAVGVGIFFVLSGFLMSYLYARATWDFQAVCRYSIARFSRIAPIYWLVVSICIVISYSAPESEFAMKIIGGYQIARHYLFVGSAGVFWSIPPEIQYYIFFLLLWWGMASRSKISYAFPSIVLLCTGLLLTHNLWPGLSLPNKLQFFLAGTVAGMVPRGTWRGTSDRTALFCLQLGALFLLMAPVWLYSSKEDLYGATELGFALAVAVYFLSIPSCWTTFVFASPLMRRIGQASFSIYLMHVLVFYYGMRWLGLSSRQYDPLWLVLGLAGVALPMAASWYIEIPLQKRTRRALEKTFGLASRQQPLAA